MRWFFISLIRAYQLALSPFFLPSCRFEPSCSAYAAQAFSEHGSLAGAWLTVKRLARCHPLCRGGVDPVPGPGRRHAA
jgi:putative membrane protein insertion efficiency factor